MAIITKETEGIRIEPSNRFFDLAYTIDHYSYLRRITVATATRSAAAAVMSCFQGDLSPVPTYIVLASLFAFPMADRIRRRGLMS